MKNNCFKPNSCTLNSFFLRSFIFLHHHLTTTKLYHHWSVIDHHLLHHYTTGLFRTDERPMVVDPNYSFDWCSYCHSYCCFYSALE